MGESFTQVEGGTVLDESNRADAESFTQVEGGTVLDESNRADAETFTQVEGGTVLDESDGDQSNKQDIGDSGSFTQLKPLVEETLRKFLKEKYGTGPGESFKLQLEDVTGKPLELQLEPGKSLDLVTAKPVPSIGLRSVGLPETWEVYDGAKVIGNINIKRF